MNRVTGYGQGTVAAAERIEQARDDATDQAERRHEDMRTTPHRYADGVYFIGHCDLCGVGRRCHR